MLKILSNTNKKASFEAFLVLFHFTSVEIQDRETSRYGLWKMSGFALAAAIAGFVVFPNSIEMAAKPQNQVVVTPKLSPQMVEDLEMLMVLGEDKVPHGS